MPDSPGHDFSSDSGVKVSPREAAATPAAAAAPAAAAPVKRLDNLFFIEELQTVSATESKWNAVCETYGRELTAT